MFSPVTAFTGGCCVYQQNAEFFIITLMTLARVILNETIAARQHQPGQTQTDFTISLPQSVDVCSLHVRIRAGNNAGMSAPSEAVEVGKL